MKRRKPSSLMSGGRGLGPPLPKTTKTALSDTQSVLNYLQSLFSPEAFNSHPPLPPIVMKHQLYSLLQDRTLIDRDLVSLRDDGCIRMFKLGVSEHDYAIITEESYKSYLQDILQNRYKLVERILTNCRDVSVNKKQLTEECGISRDQVSDLVRYGVLLVRDVGKTSSSWWFAIPGVSPFIKSLVKGRTMIQQTLKRSKFNEILESELETRKLSVSKLNMKYHIHDLIGSDVVDRVNTTSGPLLRLVVTAELSNHNNTD